MADLFSKGVAWRSFKDLEEEFIEALNYVPLRPIHDRVWSHRFGRTLDEVGSAVGSFFEAAVKEGHLLGGHEISQKIINGTLDQPNIAHFCKIVEPTYKLSTATVRVTDGAFQYGDLTPFAVFSDMVDSKPHSPWWWDAYNNYKHHRYSDPGTATLRNTLESLAGLFLLNALHKENQEVLVENGIIRGLWPEAPKMMKNRLSKSNFGVTGMTLEARSDIFTHQFRIDNRNQIQVSS